MPSLRKDGSAARSITECAGDFNLICLVDVCYINGRGVTGSGVLAKKSSRARISIHLTTRFRHAGFGHVGYLGKVLLKHLVAAIRSIVCIVLLVGASLCFMCFPWTNTCHTTYTFSGHGMGRRSLHRWNDFPRDLSSRPTKMQFRSSNFPSQRFPERRNLLGHYKTWEAVECVYLHCPGAFARSQGASIDYIFEYIWRKRLNVWTMFDVLFVCRFCREYRTYWTRSVHARHSSSHLKCFLHHMPANKISH